MWKDRASEEAGRNKEEGEGKERGGEGRRGGNESLLEFPYKSPTEVLWSPSQLCGISGVP